jgi:hypothetical protein
VNVAIHDYNGQNRGNSHDRVNLKTRLLTRSEKKLFKEKKKLAKLLVIFQLDFHSQMSEMTHIKKKNSLFIV